MAKLDPLLSNCTAQLVNGLVTFVVTNAGFDPAPVPGGPAGSFTITAVLANSSSTNIQQPLESIVVSLTNGNRLLSATAGDGGAGSKQAIVAGADAILTPNEVVTVTFVIGLAVRDLFEFFVDVQGCLLPSSSQLVSEIRG